MKPIWISVLHHKARKSEIMNDDWPVMTDYGLQMTLEKSIWTGFSDLGVGKNVGKQPSIKSIFCMLPTSRVTTLLLTKKGPVRWPVHGIFCPRFCGSKTTGKRGHAVVVVQHPRNDWDQVPSCRRSRGPWWNWMLTCQWWHNLRSYTLTHIQVYKYRCIYSIYIISLLYSISYLHIISNIIVDIFCSITIFYMHTYCIS